jgi:type IV secretory pathway TrbD component
MALRVTRIHRAGHRANLFLGADRRLMLCVAVVCIALGASFTIPGFIAIPLVWSGSLKLLRKAAAFDPQLSVIYWRYLWQRPFYPARSTPHRFRKLPKLVAAGASWT